MKFKVLLLALVWLAIAAGVRLQAAEGSPAPAMPGPHAAESPDARANPATSATPSPMPSPLRVLVTGDPPFVMKRLDETFDGVSVDVWKAAAAEIGVPFKIVGKIATDEGIREVERGHADVLIGPIGITAARARRIWFSRPYFTASQAIASLPQRNGVLGFLRGYLVIGAIICVSAFGLFFIVGMVLWLLERRGNPDNFPPSLEHGLATGMWLAVVTITTVGYGDRVPVTRAGRIFTAFWMLTAMLFASTLTASITSIFNEYRNQAGDLNRPAALVGRRIASVAGSTSANYARQWSTDVIDATSIDQAMGLLVAHRVDAVVFHEPETLYWVHQHPDVALAVATYSGAPSEYGFVFHERSSLVSQIDVALLDLAESGEIERIRQRNMAAAVPSP